MAKGTLAHVLLERLPGRVDLGLADPADLETRLEALVREGREAWPALAMSPEAFIDHLGDRLASAADPSRALAQVRAADLWLACACGQGVRGADDALERRCFGSVAAVVASIDPSPSFADDVRQALRERLFLGKDGARPAIATYAGEGSLSSWVRVSARRLAMNLVARKELPSAPEEALLAAPSPLADPEILLAKLSSQRDLREAFQAALSALGPREREILRLSVVEGLKGQQIAERLGLDAATVSRALAAAREKLGQETRRCLAERRKLSSSQIDSLVGVALSQLAVSLPRILKKPRPKR